MGEGAKRRAAVLTVSVLIPYRPDGGPRTRLDHFTFARLLQIFDGEEIIHMDDGRDHPGLFNHGQAINRAAEFATGDVFLIADADTTYDEGLLEAVTATEHDRRWRLPSRYIQLNQEATDRSLRFGTIPSPIIEAETNWIGENVSWAGLIVLPREAFDRVGGCDERYRGWGADDAALGLALETLYGPHVRYPGAAVHLDHPRGIQENGLHEYGDEGRALTRAYEAAAGDRDAMEGLIEGKRI